MKLLVKLNLILIVVFGAGFVPVSMISRSLLDENAQAQVIQNARIMLETAMAMRGYTVEQIKPLLNPHQDDEFLPQTVPAYAATEIFNTLRENHPEYTYKEATLNPTNPRNRAVDWETDLVNEFRRDPSRTEIVGERETPLGRALYLSRPIQVTDPACLSCHTTPAEAPPSMVALYGDVTGYGWQLDEVIGAQVVQVPMATPIAMADATYHTLLLTLAAVCLATMLALNLLLHWAVIRPIKRLSALADRVSQGDSDAPELTHRGKDEVAVLAGSFQRMRISLAKALNLLDED